MTFLKECHDEPCGGHFADKRTTNKVLHPGYYWPTIFRDAKKYVRSCDKCQRMGRPVKLNEMPLQPQIQIDPFEKWDLDFMGPINPPSKQKVYILVCTNYVTKWVEAKALIKATEEAMANFLYEEIFVRYRVPREIVTDQGTQFTSQLIRSITEQFKIKHHWMSTPYHPQANRQVEVTNRVLEAILTKTVQQHHKDWADRTSRSFVGLQNHLEEHHRIHSL
jgi:hypothetical protein